jgi:beta-galactosidase
VIVRAQGTLSALLRGVLAVLAVGSSLAGSPSALADQAAATPPSNRITINLGETAWRYLKDRDPASAMLLTYDDSPANTTDVWSSVGVPQSPSDNDTFLNLPSGGGEGQLTGNINWYRKHFALDQTYANRKVYVEFEGANTATQVYINGHFIKGNSLINPQATHVIGFTAFIVDLTGYVHTDGTDNVLAVKVARGDNFFESPNFSGAFRFGQDDSGLFRPVHMFITDRLHIPRNTYSVLSTWGTYVTTLSANDSVASVQVQTNVLNEYPTNQPVTLNTEIVDATGKVVVSQQANGVLASNPQPIDPVPADPTVAPPPPTFTQTLTVPNPTLWYPNNSQWGKPYLYTVVSTVSINGVVVDATTTPLGIRTVTWDENFPIINGHPHYLWGASGRYDYPALGSAVPEEQKWRDVSLLAKAGGSLYRPGHSSEGPEFLNAADAYGVMVVQPSGDGENGFATLCPDNVFNNCATLDDVELKKETHRDMIVHDRNNPSVLSWEADNGATDTSFAQSIKKLSQIWEPVITRAQADRTPNPANGDILGCSGDGCDIGVKHSFPNSPTWGSEYWGDGVARYHYDYELAFAAPYVKNWVQSVAIKSFGIAHWYLADTPGEITTQIDGPDSPMGTADGPVPADARGNEASMMDANRIPRLLYYIYQSVWRRFEDMPVVKLGYHWNRSGDVRVNAFSNCPAVRLLVNGVRQGGDMTPNPTTSDASSDLSQNTTLLPGQVFWDVTWQPGTVTAQCLSNQGVPQLDAQGNIVQDQQTTAGAPAGIALAVDPELAGPNGKQFDIEANGSDAAFITATVVDAAGNRVPDASNLITFAVSGPGTYRGGTEYAVTADQPQGYHAPGDPNLAAEGGITKIAVKSQFAPGTVTVTATSPGLQNGAASFTVNPITGPSIGSGGSLSIPDQPATALSIVTSPQDKEVAAGQTAAFTVFTAGSGTLSYQWFKSGKPIANSNSFSYTTPATLLTDDGSTYSVQVSNGPTTITSSSAKLKVDTPAPPTVNTQPTDQTVVAGQQALFSVTASGPPDLSYAWYKNGQLIPNAPNSNFYSTPAVTTTDDGTTFKVVVSNSTGSTPSNPATLHVTAATLPTIDTPPQTTAVAVNKSVTLSVVASGTAPLQYQWKLGDTVVGENLDHYSIAAAQATDAGSYTVTVSNGAGSVTSDPPAVLTVSGNNGTNLALNKPAFQSSDENDGLAAKFAFDGNLVSRWASAIGVDPSWVGVDLGSLKTFDQVVLNWQDAYATSYEVQVSSDDNTDWDLKNWATVKTNTAGKGGADTETFASTSARYVRMLGKTRATQYGYSLLEFGVYDVPLCGGPTERYTINPPQSGTYVSTIPGIPSGPFISTVTDNVSNLVWQQFVTTFQGQGDQFTQPIANSYCQSVGMRVPSLPEAMTIAGTNYSACAFPDTWTIWTTTDDPQDPTERAFFASSDGSSASNIKGNSPGAALCVSGAVAALPVIITQPASQTVAVGSSAQFTVGVQGTGPFSYTWFEGSNQVGITTVPTFTTVPIQDADDKAAFTVVVSNGGGSVTSNPAIITVDDSAPTGGDGGGNNGGGGGGNNPPPPPPTSTTNLAAGKTVTAYSTETPGNPPSAAVDSNLATRWESTYSDLQWITVDLGSAQTVDRAVLRWEDAHATDFKIQTSTDNSTWTDVAVRTGDAGGDEDIPLISTNARYVRMYGTKRSSQYGYSLYEFELYNTANTPKFPVTVSAGANGSVTPGTVQLFQGGQQNFTFQPADGYAATGVLVDGQSVGEVNSYNFDNVQVAHTLGVTFAPASAAIDLALKQPATSSGLEADAYPASSAVDGDPTTRWSSSYFDQSWLEVDLGSAKPFDRTILTWQDAHAIAYQIQVSNDEQTWTPVYNMTEGKGGIEDLTFTEVTARFVRFFGQKRSSAYGYSLYSFQVFDMPTPPAVTTQPANQTGAVGGTVQFAVGASGSNPFRYDWYENGNLVGTTSQPSFTTATLTAADDKAAFHAVISNSAGSAPSNDATLTVTVPTGGTGSNTGSNGTGSGDTGSAGGTGATSPQPSSGPNLAIGKDVTASSVQTDGNPASAAVDGNVGSRWESMYSDPQWITVDLGSAQTVDRAVLRWENAYATDFKIQTSTDNSTWTDVAVRTADTGGDEDIPLTATNARYVRMYGTKRSSQYGYSLYEFEIYNTANTPKFPVAVTASANGSVTPGSAQLFQGGQQNFTFQPASGYAATAVIVDGQSVGEVSSYNFDNVQAAHSLSVTFAPASTAVDLAFNKVATSSGLEADAYPAADAVDNNPNSRWSSSFADPSWLAVDLGAMVPFNRAVLSWQDAHAIAYQIQVSNDNKTWTPVYTMTAGKGGIEDLPFQQVTARYVRMYGTQRSTPYGYSLWSFQIFNTQTGSTSTGSGPVITAQPQNQTVSLGQGAVFSVTATGTGPFTYQWQKGGANIAGAPNSSSYTTPAAASGDNNATFDVIVTDSTGASVTSQTAALTVSGAGLPYQLYPGFIGVDLQNNTNGTYPDDQVYVAVIGREHTSQQFAWVKPDGTITMSSVADNDGPGHLTGPDGQNYSNYFFTLAQAKLLKMPHLDSGRVFISLGKPLYIKILTDINNQIGYAGPNPLNPSDPNINTYFDWMEFTNNDGGLFINTTQVDEYGLSMLLDVYGSNNTFHMQTGIKETRASIYAEYLAETPAAFHLNPLSQYRIMSPANDTFDVNQPNEHYFDDYVTQIWNQYTTSQLAMTIDGTGQFLGQVQNNQMVFTQIDPEDGTPVAGATYVVNKPTTQDVLRGAGALASDGGVVGQLEAQMCAAFNRHIMGDTTKWATPAAYYGASPANWYAKFWHDHSVGGLAYGFAYDDVQNQSSTIQAGSPEHAVFGIGF